MVKFDTNKKYKIRQWHDMANEYGCDDDGDINIPGGFLTDMDHLCGKVVLPLNYSYITDNYLVDGWRITKEMLEGIDTKPKVRESKTNLLSFIDAFKIAVENDKKIKHSSMLSPVEWLEFFWDYSKSEIIEMKKSDEWEVF